ncbi:hypothetical protein ACFWXH_04770 [Mesorhizobium sp. NPDC059054]|uniref:hypothetical protein n=1 Tax=Mesorhizobium sp. NPDC059054 TaxID=3346711 RepID=UPI0036B57E4E
MTDNTKADETAEETQLNEPAGATLPINLCVTVSGLAEEDGTRLGQAVLGAARAISRHIDLERLDGITLSSDYEGALASLDRGYETSHVLAPSSEFVIGIAMTPTVRRDGMIKSRIVLNANIIWPIQDVDDELFQRSVHIIAHECAHVEVTMMTDRAFPNLLLTEQFGDLLQHSKREVTWACWDEYAACRISADWGEDPLDSYAEMLISTMTSIRERANELIRAYRVHGDHGQIIVEVTGQYGNLMKYASYLAGHIDGVGRSLADVHAVDAALREHWFRPFFERLHGALQGIWTEYGKWTDHSRFELVGAILEDVLAEIGMTFYYGPDGELGFKLPYRRDTMPAGAEWLAAQ